MGKASNRMRLTEREDGYIISTVKSYDNWHGAYETAIRLEGLDYWNIAEGYEKYVAMSEEEICRIKYIG